MISTEREKFSRRKTKTMASVDDDPGAGDGAQLARQVAHRRVAPQPVVEPEHEEGAELQHDHQRQRVARTSG